jgi:glutathione S-transferase
MLELKGIEYELATVLPGTQRVHLRLVGFRGGTVPALKLDDRRVQGTRAIARALEAARPGPHLFPTDEAVERWADEELQMVPRRILRWGLTWDAELRRWISEASGVPAPGAVGALGLPAAKYYARAVGADEAAVRRALDELPGTLARVDALLADGVLTPDAPDAATLQVLCSVRALDGFADLHDRVAAHPCAAPARELFPDYPEIPAFLPFS